MHRRITQQPPDRMDKVVKLRGMIRKCSRQPAIGNSAIIKCAQRSIPMIHIIKGVRRIGSPADNPLEGKESDAAGEQGAIEPARTRRQHFAISFKQDEPNQYGHAQKFVNHLRPQNHGQKILQRQAANIFKKEMAIGQGQEAYEDETGDPQRQIVRNGSNIWTPTAQWQGHGACARADGRGRLGRQFDVNRLPLQLRLFCPGNP